MKLKFSLLIIGLCTSNVKPALPTKEFVNAASQFYADRLPENFKKYAYDIVKNPLLQNILEQEDAKRITVEARFSTIQKAAIQVYKKLSTLELIDEKITNDYYALISNFLFIDLLAKEEVFKNFSNKSEENKNTEE